MAGYRHLYLAECICRWSKGPDTKQTLWPLEKGNKPLSWHPVAMWKRGTVVYQQRDHTVVGQTQRDDWSHSQESDRLVAAGWTNILSLIFSSLQVRVPENLIFHQRLRCLNTKAHMSLENGQHKHLIVQTGSWNAQVGSLDKKIKGWQISSLSWFLSVAEKLGLSKWKLYYFVVGIRRTHFC